MTSAAKVVSLSFVDPLTLQEYLPIVSLLASIVIIALFLRRKVRRHVHSGGKIGEMRRMRERITRG